MIDLTIHYLVNLLTAFLFGEIREWQERNVHRDRTRIRVQNRQHSGACSVTLSKSQNGNFPY